MSTNKTNNLQLHQWEGADAVSRAEFNENFAKLDGESAAIRGVIAETAATIPRIVMGTYVGDNSGSYSAPRVVGLGFRPSLLLVQNPFRGYVAVLPDSGQESSGMKISDTGFTCYNTEDSRLAFNYAGQTYTYWAIR